MKSGDTEKIIFFANVAKQKEVYIMAGNYLQSLEWRNQSKVAEHIINFYTKAQALDLLASFYDSCSQIEIEECQDYEGGLKALIEAHNCLSECKTISGEQDEKKLQLQNKITFIKKLILAKSLLETNSQQAEQKLQALFEDPGLECTMHPAHVFTLLVQHHVSTQDYQMVAVSLQHIPFKCTLSQVETLYGGKFILCARSPKVIFSLSGIRIPDKVLSSCTVRPSLISTSPAKPLG
uniref:Uncharacterized protein n=1 Tax=Eptatretus burgeri TaxID=7764 RepID=A0A8C4QUM6_EPTBU